MKSTLITLFSACLMFPSIGSAKIIYVATHGQDDAIGSIHQPLKSIQTAIDQANPGDEIKILPGVYTSPVVIQDKKGSSEKVLKIEGTGDVILKTVDDITLGDHTPNDEHSDLPLSAKNHPYHPYFLGSVLRIHNCDYVEIEGIEIRDSAWFGISARNSDHLSIRRCKTQNTQASGIYVLDCTNVSLKDSEVTKACAREGRLPEGNHGSQECVSFVNTSHFEIAYNRVHESGTWNWSEEGGTGVGGEGIDVKENSHHGKVHHNYVYNLSRLGLYVDAWNSDLSDIELYSNVVHDCMHGIALGCEDGGTLSNISIHDNLLTYNRYMGIVLSSWGLSGSKSDISIINNTVYHNGMNGIELGSKLHKNIKVINNIAWANADLDKVLGGKHFSDFNPGEAKNIEVHHNLFDIDPLFVNPVHGDYRLQENSPAIDAGIKQGISNLDLNDKTRVVGHAVDCGAFEKQ